MPNLRANGIDIEYEEFGRQSDPTLLLVMGLGAQMIAWDERFCQTLADGGFRVIRFDNRDVGLSSKVEDGPEPDVAKAMTGDASTASYTVDDMADDAAALLDALGIDKAHIVGASMGGMIVQAFAIRHPNKTASLCSIMSTTGDRTVGQPDQAAMGALLAPPPQSREEAMQRGIEGQKVIGSKTHPADPEVVARRAALAYDRSFYPKGMARQLVGIMASPDRTAALGSVDVPTLVVHGEEDPLVTPSGGEATAKAIPGAELMMVAGMGHDLPEPLWPQITEAIIANAGKANELEGAK